MTIFRVFLSNWRPLSGPVLALLIVGCAPTRDSARSVPEKPPSVSFFQDPQTNISKYQTFAVFPFSLLSNEEQSNELLDRQLLFFLRNQMELSGYLFSENPRVTDFLVTFKLYSEGETVQSPPDVFNPPSSKSPAGPSEPKAWGTLFKSSSDSFMPPDAIPVFNARPLKSIRNPTAVVAAYDRNSNKLVWSGSGKDEAHASPDARVSGQFAIAAVLSHFPVRDDRQEQFERGAIGARIGIYTLDGSSYLPTILYFPDISPARDSGLRKSDRIAAVNGISLANRPFREAMSFIRGEPNSVVTFDVLRQEKKLTFKVKRMPWSKVWGDLLAD